MARHLVPVLAVTIVSACTTDSKSLGGFGATETATSGATVDTTGPTGSGAVLAAGGGALFVVAVVLFALDAVLLAQHVCPGASKVAHMMAARYLMRPFDLARKAISFILNLLSGYRRVAP